jgi:hypothetical protein
LTLASDGRAGKISRHWCFSHTTAVLVGTEVKVAVGDVNEGVGIIVGGCKVDVFVTGMGLFDGVSFCTSVSICSAEGLGIERVPEKLVRKREIINK